MNLGSLLADCCAIAVVYMPQVASMKIAAVSLVIWLIFPKGSYFHSQISETLSRKSEIIVLYPVHDSLFAKR